MSKFFRRQCQLQVVKMGVQYSLWGGSVLNLGTSKHRQRFFDDINMFRAPGCFAMTELKHGSNVAMLQTQAVFDAATDEWVISTPDEGGGLTPAFRSVAQSVVRVSAPDYTAALAGAIKWWIGNAAEDGQWATVFARLRIPTEGAKGGVKDHGVHAFICPLRNEDGSLVSGVEIRDCGYKVGLNGVRHRLPCNLVVSGSPPGGNNIHSWFPVQVLTMARLPSMAFASHVTTSWTSLHR